tara:strand:- start:3731 stop:3907 length:177 start_codon:yes stop_codon:yes gene_type:complete
MYRIDRIARNGDIREHMTDDGDRTICGLRIEAEQPAIGNRTCRRCERIAARRAQKGTA